LSIFGLDRLGRVGIGGDVTLYQMSPEVQVIYGGSRSFHAFLRWRPRVAGPPHIH
jgi:hypothetical protein